MQPTLADVRKAALAIDGQVLHTPLLPVPRQAHQGHVVCMISGGNVDLTSFHALLNGGA